MDNFNAQVDSTVFNKTITGIVSFLYNQIVRIKKQFGVRRRYLVQDATPAGTPANTIETTLKSYTIPFGNFNVLGSILHLFICGTTGVDPNLKQIRIKLNGNLIFDSGTFMINNMAWALDVKIIALAVNSQQIFARLFLNGIAQTVAFTAVMVDFNAADVVLTITGQNGTGILNDLLIKYLSLEYSGIGSSV